MTEGNVTRDLKYQDSEEEVKIGKDAEVDEAPGTVAIGAGASISSGGEDAVAIGRGAMVQEDAQDGIAIGTDSIAGNRADISIGPSAANNLADSEEVVLIGAYSSIEGDGSSFAGYANTLVGPGTSSNMTNGDQFATAVGAYSSVDADNGLTLGAESSVGSGADYGIAIGSDAEVMENAESGIAIGQGAVADGTEAVIAFGAGNVFRLDDQGNLEINGSLTENADGSLT